MIYLIQGFYFVNGEWLEVDEGAGDLLIKTGTRSRMFSGVIFPDSSRPVGYMAGYMYDRIGESVLMDVVITPEILHFMKNYGRPLDEPIYYQFHRKGSLWVGEYQGKTTLNGGATCITTEILDNNLFYPPNLHT